MSLLAQSDIERMREPDTCFLQLLPDDWGVHHDISRVDVHFARGVITGRTLSNAVPQGQRALVGVAAAADQGEVTGKRMAFRAGLDVVAAWRPIGDLHRLAAARQGEPITARRGMVDMGRNGPVEGR